MPNTNPQAVKFANERFRKLADKTAQHYLYCIVIREKIAAGGIDNLFPANKDPIVDGSAEDGRSPLTNEDIKAMISGMNQIIDFYEANPNLKDLMLRVAVNSDLF